MSLPFPHPVLCPYDGFLLHIFIDSDYFSAEGTGVFLFLTGVSVRGRSECPCTLISRERSRGIRYQSNLRSRLIRRSSSIIVKGDQRTPTKLQRPQLR